MNIRRSLLVPLCGLICWTAAIADPGDYRPQVGEYHPDVTLLSIDSGDPVSLRQFRGKKTLLIHFASW